MEAHGKLEALAAPFASKNRNLCLSVVLLALSWIGAEVRRFMNLKSLFGPLNPRLEFRAIVTCYWQDQVLSIYSSLLQWKKEMAAQEAPPGYDPELDAKPKTKSARRNARKKEKRLQVLALFALLSMADSCLWSLSGQICMRLFFFPRQ